MVQYTLPIRVYFEDTDAGGIVYHTSYLKFFERARVEAFRTIGFELNKLLSDFDTQFVVHSLAVDYVKSAVLDQLLWVTTEITEVGFASISYNQKAFLESEAGVLLCRASVRLACINRQFQLRKLPEILVRSIK